MTNPPWFYYPFDELDTHSFELSGPEVRHITGARRLRVEDQLILMNGKGKLAHCMLEQIDKRAQTLTLRVSLVAEIEPPTKELVLAAAIPKGDRLATMLDMVSQLGVTRFVPLVFEHSVSKWSDKLCARCERIVIEAAKQSKRAWVPSIDAPERFDKLVCDTENTSTCTFLADQYGQALHSYTRKLESAPEIFLIIGPEGGISRQERQLAINQNVSLLKLAEPILRIETAAVAGVTALNLNRT